VASTHGDRQRKYPMDEIKFWLEVVEEYAIMGITFTVLTLLFLLVVLPVTVWRKLNI
jgi:hypothetical protein